jgi:hypothetical protein
MGFRKPMDYNSVKHQIYMTGVGILDSRNDGYIQFEMKKDLYRLQCLINDIIDTSPIFSDEDEFLKMLEKEKIYKILNK